MGNILSYIRFPDLSEASGVRYENIIDSLAGWDSLITGGGAIDLFPGFVMINGGIGAGDNVYLKRFIDHPYFTFSWDKKRIIKTLMSIYLHNGASADNYFGSGFLPDDGPGFGFRFKDTGVYGFAKDATTFVEVPIWTFPPAEWDKLVTLTAILFPGSRIQFTIVVDGNTYSANIDTHLPIGEDLSRQFWHWLISQGSVNPTTYTFSIAYFFQDT